MELGGSRWVKNTLLKSAKIFHYRQTRSENFANFESFDQLLTLTKFDQMPTIYLNKDLMLWFLMILTNPKRCGTPVRSFSTKFRAEISVMCQKTKVSVLWKKIIFFTLTPTVGLTLRQAVFGEHLTENLPFYKTREWRSGRLPSANTSQKKNPFF